MRSSPNTSPVASTPAPQQTHRRKKEGPGDRKSGGRRLLARPEMPSEDPHFAILAEFNCHLLVYLS